MEQGGGTGGVTASHVSRPVFPPTAPSPVPSRAFPQRFALFGGKWLAGRAGLAVIDGISVITDEGEHCSHVN